MKRRKFHCHICEAPCEVYRKGKTHRILICPNHGILASNPLPLMAVGLAGKALKGIGRATGIVKPSQDKVSPTQRIIHVERDEFSPEEKISLALK